MDVEFPLLPGWTYHGCACGFLTLDGSCCFPSFQGCTVESIIAKVASYAQREKPNVENTLLPDKIFLFFFV